MKRQVDVWGSWSEWSKCSRSCGGGVSFRQRHCYSQRTEGSSSCVGPTRSYQSCNVQNCPEGSRDFRAEQCAEFDGTEFQGKKYKWLPYYGAPNKCELNCIPKGENFYYRHKEAVVDGTTCEPGKRDICVEGICQAVGCDNMLESAKKEDKCLQCGGDGSTCYGVKGTFDVASLPKGYNQIFIIPVGATSIQIKEVKPSRNFLAVKNVRGEYYLNGHWTIDFSRALQVASTVLHYDRGSEGDVAPELLHARGPITEPLVIELISQEPNTGVQYEYYLPLQGQASGYSWSYSSWSECSSECGGGFQSRLVFCTIDNEIYPDYMCRNKPQPDNNRTCGHQPCPQTKRWKTGEWGSCSASCGGGTQTRSVYCVAFDGQSWQGVVDDTECMAFTQQPRRSQPCNVQQCATWSTGPWSQPLLPAHCLVSVPKCSKSCDSGIRTRQVICADGDSKFYSTETCKAIQPQKPATLGSCNTQPCYLPQQVPSMQDTMGYDVTRQSLLTRYNPNSPAPDSDDRSMLPGNIMIPRTSGMAAVLMECQLPRVQTTLDAHNIIVTFKRDKIVPLQQLQHQALSQQQPSGECRGSMYGCCFDNVASATGPRGEGCLNSPNYPYPVMCLLPSAHGPCTNWTTRWYFVGVVGKCNRFWYGGCHGNKNSFESEEECMRVCHSSVGVSHQELQPSPGTGALQHQQTGSSSHAGRAQGQQQSHTREAASHSQERRTFGSSLPTQDSRRQDSWRRDVLPESLPRTGVLESQRWDTQRSRLDSLGQLRSWEAATPGPSDRQSSRGQQVLPQEGKQWHEAFGTDASVTEGFGHQESADLFPAQALHRTILEEAKPSLVTAAVGQNIQLVCKTGVSSLSRVEWMKNSRPVSSDRHTYQSDSSLVISHVQPQDAGTYTCRTSNGRTESRQIQLQITGDLSPERLKMDKSEPTVVEANVGERVRLPCTVEASPALTIEWQKDGQPLSSPRHRQQSDGALVISRVSSEDIGFFTCIASNGRDRDQRHVLLRPLGELRITGLLPSITVPEGGTAQLHCTVTGSNVNIRWSRNGVPMRGDGHHIHLSQDGSLTISNVQEADEGSYTCSAYSSSSSVSASSEVKVLRSQPSTTVSHAVDLSRECVDQPHLANCDLILQAQLCVQTQDPSGNSKTQVQIARVDNLELVCTLNPVNQFTWT
ncbi:papilin, proteoglycan like sulfated glycoprotein [Turdus rufiventris]|nr:papilin, proteoglycan like sulfated glycoprotein [Turdus rufiventris]